MLARDDVTLQDPNELGQEWQVMDADPKLFQKRARAPQYTHKSASSIPLPTTSQRRLLEAGSVSKEEAEVGCAHWKEHERDNCVSDVMAMNDLGLARSGGY